MSEKQLLAKYLKERAVLVADQATRQTRLDALDGVIEALRVVLGEKPARRAPVAATGTKALILDVLANGTRRKGREIADAVKVRPAAVSKHLAQLVAAGDVTVQGKSRATTYGIP